MMECIAEMFPSKVYFNYFEIRTELWEVCNLDGSNDFTNLMIEVDISQISSQTDLTRDRWTGTVHLRDDGTWYFTPDKYCRI